MAVLRLFAVSLFFFLMTVSPAILIVMFAYLLIPADITLIIMGGLVVLMAIVAFLFFAGMFGIGIMGLGLRSRTASKLAGSYPDNIQAVREVLEHRGFWHLGDWYSDKFFTKEKRLNLIYLSDSQQIAVELRQDDEGKAQTIYSSIWDNGQYLVTEWSTTGYIIVKDKYRYMSIKNGDDAAYKHHIEQIKEVEEAWGKAAQIQSLEQLQNFEVDMMQRSAADILYTASWPVIRAFVGVSIPLLAFAALPVAGAAYSQALPEADSISKEAPGILFVVMTALVALGYRFLLKPSMPAKAD